MIAILYAATSQPVDIQNYSLAVSRPPWPFQSVWIRLEVVPGNDVERGLAKAEPRKGEIVLNAIVLGGDVK